MAPPADSSKSKPVLALSAEPKARGANRSTKVAGKLKVLPDQPADAPPLPSGAGALPPPPPAVRDFVTRVKDANPGMTSTDSDDEEGDDEGVDEQQGEEVRPRCLMPCVVARLRCRTQVYNQIAQIPEGTARRDALKLTKARAKNLPRVTAYATAKYAPSAPLCMQMAQRRTSSYRFHELMKFFKARREAYHTDPKTLEDVIYTPYAYEPAAADNGAPKDGADAVGDLLGVPELAADSGAEGPPARLHKRRKSKFDLLPTHADIFIFKYGTVVIWGMTEAQEKRFLSSMCVGSDAVHAPD
jgi:hypothetical protein